jgi:chromosome segregation ATPase
MTEDRPADYQQRILDLENSLLRQDQLYFDKLNQYAKELESYLEKISQYDNENQSLKLELQHKDAEVQNLADQIRLRDEKISELIQFLDVNYLAIQQAQDELELCHLQCNKNRDDYVKSIKKQVFLLANTLINRSRKSISSFLPYRVLRRGKRILDRLNSCL